MALACGAALTAITGFAAEGNSAAGAKKIVQCQGCHGIPGYHTGYPAVYHVPKLGGQHAAYLVNALKGYKSGERGFATMQAVAAELSDQDMADIAAYYASDVPAAVK